jgi:hypothetical protein
VDWGLRSLITVSILEKPEGDEEKSYRQISRPVFLESGGLDGRQARPRREIDRRKRVPRTLWEARQRSGHRSCRTQETVTSPFPEAVPSVPHERVEGLSQACFIYWSRRGPTVAAAGDHPRPFEGKRVYYAGWSYSIALRTSQPKSVLAILSSSRFRKCWLDRA